MALKAKLFELARVDDASEVVKKRTARARAGKAGFLASRKERSALKELDPKMLKRTLRGQLRDLINELKQAEFEFSRAIRQNLNLEKLSQKGVRVKNLKSEVRQTRQALKEATA